MSEIDFANKGVWVEKEIASYSEATGVVGDTPDTIVSDMICDLLHWLKARTGDKLETVDAARRGIASYLREVDANSIEDAIDADAFVTITADVDGAAYVWEQTNAFALEDRTAA